MKKSLTALCFALCATFAFAQTSNVAKKMDKAALSAPVKVELSQAQPDNGYKGSIFTKTEGDIFLQNDFSTAPTVGVLGASDQVMGKTSDGRDTLITFGTTLAHLANHTYNRWARVDNMTVDGNIAPATDSYLDGDFTDFVKSPTATNGFMYMAMLEAYRGWGGTGETNPYNAYISLGAVTIPEGTTGLEMMIWQNYRKFNYDQCFIDYKTPGATVWSQFEINVKYVDVDVNGWCRGNYRLALPLASNVSGVEFRIRWCAPAGSLTLPAGYFWIVDDVKIQEVMTNRITLETNEYFEGFYHKVPQGLELPIVWNATIHNRGSNTHNNFVGEILHQTSRTANPTTIVSTESLNNFAYFDDANLLVDPKGWWNNNGFGYMVNEENVSTGTLAYLPTTQLGANYTYADMHSDNWEHMYRLVDSTSATGYRFEADDLHMYEVTPVEHNRAVWGHDNGVLTPNNYWAYGMIAQTTYTSDTGFAGWKSRGYRVLNSYVTGDNIPEGWVIKGVQIVPVANAGLAQPQVQIYPQLFWDSVRGTADGMSCWFNRIETGGAFYTITDDDLNYTLSGTPAFDNGDEEFPSYNVITLDFPEQPALLPNTSYRVGYYNGGGNFLPASANPAGFYDLSNQARYFSELDGMEDYGTSFGHPNWYNTLIFDPTFASESVSGWHWFNFSTFPMIRMIVGPYEVLPTHPITFECGDNGTIYADDEITVLCDQIIKAVTTSTKSFVAIPDEGYDVEEIFVNGESIFYNDQAEDNEEDYLSGSVSFECGPEYADLDTVAFKVTFQTAKVGIDPVAAKVSMNLMPNPATSNVRLSIEGVEGMVNLSIIDMSGRVIRSNNVNAEQTQNINLSGLAKGAYFVRITNNDMTKVEKLIVR